MNIDVIISPEYIKEEYIKDRVVIVIDMLRATSVITTAFINGCEEVIPFLTVEETLEKAKELGGNCLLGGERRAVKIEGFDLSNSPLDYTRDVVENKKILITTTNGTRTLTACKNAKRVFVASMLNGRAVAEKLVELGEDVVIINSGTYGEYTMDDFICTGYIINEILNITDKVYLTDIAKTANYIYENNRDIESFIKHARHYGVMKDLGLMEDINYCMRKSITKIVPEYKNGHIIK